MVMLTSAPVLILTLGSQVPVPCLSAQTITLTTFEKTSSMVSFTTTFPFRSALFRGISRSFGKPEQAGHWV